MGHPGKHIIDPETGLCVICDKEAIQEVTQGRRPEKQYIYPNQNDEAPYQKVNKYICIHFFLNITIGSICLRSKR